MSAATIPLATRLNDGCQCIWVDRDKLATRVKDQIGSSGAALPDSMVSGSVVFVDQRHVTAMDRTIALITRAIRSPAFAARIAESAPAIARRTPPAAGGVLGFDFHLGQAEPQLIEINTNPGGLLVSLETARAATAVCDCLSRPLPAMAAADVPIDEVEARVVAAFRAEFQCARHPRPLRTVAIVDDAPNEQYLLPEFMLYRRIFEQAGYRVLVADATQLAVRGEALVLGDDAIDLVYNRCTDFYFESDRHAALRDAYERDLAVITPHPAAHARWADKRILAWLRDASLLRSTGLADKEIEHLDATIPATEVVEPARADALWSRRRELFFKPVDGFGGRAAYRGDKLTRKTFAQILAGRYVAQAIAPPSSRRVRLPDGSGPDMRVDVRNFALQGATLLRAARLYRGQTTNFRTAGGGFAPVLTVPASGGHDARA